MRARARLVAASLAPLALAGCDDQIKYIPIFSAMTEQPSVEAYEAETPRTPVPGTMPVDGERTYGLLAADTALANPLAGGTGDRTRGAELFGVFCTPCHGPQGRGDGSVVGPNRIPEVPMLDLHTERARGFSDGYVWGMITNGRGLMPSYRRIASEDRWRIVSFVRQLQAGGAPGAPAADTAAADTTAADTTGADTAQADTAAGGGR